MSPTLLACGGQCYVMLHIVMLCLLTKTYNQDSVRNSEANASKFEELPVGKDVSELPFEITMVRIA